MKIGCTYSPWLGNVDIAPAISATVISAAPTQMAGTGSIGLVTPILRAMFITILGPLGPPDFIRKADTQFMELANAHFKVTYSPSRA